MLSVLAVAVTLAFTGQVPTTARLAQRPRMPFLIDQTIENATRAIGRFNLRIDTVRIAGPPDRASIVLRQFPDSGVPLTSETVVRLTVGMIAVPNLRGLTKAEVERVLAARRLRVGRDQVLPPGGEPDTAVRQSPAAQTLVAANQPVNVYYAAAPAGPPPVLMPSVIDSTLTTATNMLTRLGLRVDTVRRAGPVRTALRIVEQAPARGTRITSETRATIVVSLIEVPDLSGMTDIQVGEMLSRNLLQPGSLSTVVAAGDSGTVFRQGPNAGELVLPGTAVDLVFIQPAPQTPPPNVTPATTPTVDTQRATQPTTVDTAGTTVIRITEPEPPPRNTEAGNDIWPLPPWVWVIGGLLLLLGAGAATRNRLTKRERELVERAKTIVTVSPKAPLAPRVTVRSQAGHASIRYVVSDGETQITVRAIAPFVIGEERTHV